MLEVSSSTNLVGQQFDRQDHDQQRQHRLTSSKSANNIVSTNSDDTGLKRVNMNENGLIKSNKSTVTPVASKTSRIVNFYSGRSILVTGASGFLGKLLIEKLLRSCSNLRRIFVLIRPRRNKSASERFGELFNSVIFTPLREQFANSNSNSKPDTTDSTNSNSSDGNEAFNRFLSDKITLLEGDLTEPLLGLSEQQLEVLASEVTVVLHSAAIVSFDGKLKRSIKTNLTGTYQVLQVACKLPRLISFVHVSTCYSNCTLTEIDEHIYPVNVDPLAVIDMADCFNDDLLELLRERLLDRHPNPYTYTKQLCEHLCGQYAISKGLPVLICRPSIVISTLEEPLVGFVDNRNGANGLWEAIGRGVLRVAPGSNSALADMVPADLVVNCIIALGWFADQYHRARLEVEPAAAAAANSTNRERVDKDNGNDTDTDACLIGRKMIDYYQTRKARLVKKLESSQKAEEAAPAATDTPGLHPKSECGRDNGSNKWRELIQVPVVHVSSGVENPITFNRMARYIGEGSQKCPSQALFREPKFTLIPLGLRFKLARLCQHTIVACLMDILSRLSLLGGPTAIATPTPPTSAASQSGMTWTKEFERVDRFVGVLPYFLSNSWYFNPESKLVLSKEFMTEEDRRLFNCHSAVSIDWRSFAHQIAYGMRKYISGESEDSIEAARAQYKWTYWRNTALQAALTATLGYIGYMSFYRLIAG